MGIFAIFTTCQNCRFPRGPSCLLIDICHTFAGEFGEFAIFAIFANFAKIAAFQGGPLGFSFAFATQLLVILVNSPFSPYSSIRQNRRFPRGPSCLLICICHTFVGDFGEFAIFAIFANFAKIAAFQGGPLVFSFAFATHSLAILANSPFSPYSPISPISPLSKGALLSSHLHLPYIRWRFWRMCHFRHIRQFRQNRRFPRGPFWLHIGICHTFAGDFGEFAIFAIFANFAKIAAFQGGPLVFSFAFATHSLAILANSPFSPYSPISPKSPLSKGALLASHWHLSHIRQRFWRIRHFCHIRQFRQNRRFPRGPSCLLICICHTFVGDFGEFAIFAIFANFAKIATFQGGPLVFSFAFATHLLAILANLPFLPFSPLSLSVSYISKQVAKFRQNCHFRYWVHFWTYLMAER